MSKKSDVIKQLEHLAKECDKLLEEYWKARAEFDYDKLVKQSEEMD